MPRVTLRAVSLDADDDGRASVLLMAVDRDRDFVRIGLGDCDRASTRPFSRTLRREFAAIVNEDARGDAMDTFYRGQMG